MRAYLFVEPKKKKKVRLQEWPKNTVRANERTFSFGPFCSWVILGLEPLRGTENVIHERRLGPYVLACSVVESEVALIL